jgi:cytochrome c
MFVRVLLFSVLITLPILAAPARAESPPDAATLKLGKRVFLLCQSCHSTEKDGRNKIGPNLWGIFGRVAGTKPDFRYSNALKNSKITWNDQTMDQWLTNPTKFVPGSKMAFRGVDNPANRKAVIAYLKQQTGAGR